MRQYEKGAVVVQWPVIGKTNRDGRHFLSVTIHACNNNRTGAGNRVIAANEIRTLCCFYGKPYNPCLHSCHLTPVTIEQNITTRFSAFTYYVSNVFSAEYRKVKSGVPARNHIAPLYGNRFSKISIAAG